jgi:Kdo2-lipid IVA lauroyltransferase/acyltransferase
MIRKFLVLLGQFLALAAYTLGIRKRVTHDNLKRAFPDFTYRRITSIAKASYKNLGSVFAEMVYLRFASQENIIRRVEINASPETLQTFKGKTGAIVVSAHYSNWEWMAMGAARHLGSEFFIIVKNVAGKWSERFLQKMRVRTGNKLIPTGDVRAMFKVLKQGSSIALLGDQAAPGESVRVPFFGVGTPTYEGPARLALRTRVPLVFGICMPAQGGKYIIELHRINYDDLIDTSDESIRELTSRHVKVLEGYIRENPEQWLWQHRRWKNA